MMNQALRIFWEIQRGHWDLVLRAYEPQHRIRRDAAQLQLAFYVMTLEALA